MTIYLVRHGQSVGNANMMCYGHHDYPLTEQGEKDAALAGKKLRDETFEVCWTSTLCRAVKTAEICVAGREVALIPTPLLREQFMGEFENVAFSDLLIKYPKEALAMIQNWSENPPPGGESFQDLYQRVSEFVDMLLEDGRSCLVVAHNGSLAALTARLLGLEPARAMCFRFEHGCVSRIRLSKRCNYLEKFNV